MKKILDMFDNPMITAVIALVLILASCGDSDILTFIKENSGAPDTIMASYTVDIGRSARKHSESRSLRRTRRKND